jgi:diguanylate cyclase (GGDEF)-like protein/putative nucleotidyltransferase with HDIG domain
MKINKLAREGFGWIGPAIIALAGSWLLLAIIYRLFNISWDFIMVLSATSIAVLITTIIYKRGIRLFTSKDRSVLQRNHEEVQKLYELASEIQSITTLKEKGQELLVLLIKVVSCHRAALLLNEPSSEDLTVQLAEPETKDDPLSNLRLKRGSVLVNHLRGEQETLTRQNLVALMKSSDPSEREQLESDLKEIELFVPLISRGSLTGILVLGNKKIGPLTLEDANLVENIGKRITARIEKEYLRELRERERELSAINRSSSIIASSLDIQTIYVSFIDELRKLVDVSWAAVVLIEDDFYYLALSPGTGSASQEGLPVKGTGTEWVATHKKTIVEPDLSQESKFVTGEAHRSQGIRSIAYVPLINQDKCIGSLIVASQKADAYHEKQIKVLEQLAAQITIPVRNSRLYLKAEEKARVDELSGLLNRRALDELITNEIARHSRYGGVFSLIILDLDSFKEFNDKYGHPAGDDLLREVSTIMKRTIRGSDQAFRYGGDEFAILLPETSLEAAQEVAERVRKRIAAELATSAVPVTASIGVASWPTNGTRPNEVIAAADTALYQAKRNGGNQIRCALESLTSPDEITSGFRDEQEDSTLSIIFSLAATVDAMDNYTLSHSKRVKELTIIIAEALNLQPLEIGKLETCALLHDIGKISISNKILNKRGKLTAQEWEAIKDHPQIGANIVSHARQLMPCIPGILHHHERYDGNGYPKGLKGEDIPLDARILAIADAFAAMTADRPYTYAISFEDALKEIRQGAGSQFDPYLVDVFLMVIRDYRSVTI